MQIAQKGTNNSKDKHALNVQTWEPKKIIV